MKNTQEFAGKDVETAIKNACTALNFSEKELKYDVISAGASGIFGIVGRKDAKIRVVVPDVNKKTVVDDGTDMEGIRSIVDEAFGEETRIESTPPAKQPEEPRKAEPVVDVTQDSIDLGIEALQKMANLITDDAQITTETQQDHLTLKIEGGNAGILIGRKGQTLDAMQFLTDKIVNRKSDDRVRVKVDIEGYMETRKSNLKHLAYKMADKAKKTGRPATINQMSAQDRRIVHLALKDDKRVRTQSMGDGYYRRLVIFPKKKSSFRGKRRLRR
ncbi:MAG: KH domain-containing protein [Desulfobacteraceae bacterium]|nr:KH domain-containing protein [Desulfobacteraceae bacterium]